jgi:hypothetical protein
VQPGAICFTLAGSCAAESLVISNQAVKERRSIMPVKYTAITNRHTHVLGTLIAMLVVGGISNDIKAEPAKKDNNVAFKNFRFRIIEPWHEPDGLSFFSHCPNIFTLKDMRQTTPSSHLGRYVTQVRDWGFNYMAMYGTPEQDPNAWRNFPATSEITASEWSFAANGTRPNVVIHGPLIEAMPLPENQKNSVPTARRPEIIGKNESKVTSR